MLVILEYFSKRKKNEYSKYTNSNVLLKVQAVFDDYFGLMPVNWRLKLFPPS